jgi:nitroreductase
MSVASENLVGFLRSLRAVKEYTDEPVDQESIEAILEVARWTGTGGNRQPTEIVVVRDPNLKEKMGNWGARPAGQATVVFLLVVANDASPLDEGRLAERVCLAASAVGLGSTVATLKEEGPDEVKKILGIPAEHRARTLIAVGHPATSAPRFRPTNSTTAPGRKPMSEFAHWDRY